MDFLSQVQKVKDNIALWQKSWGDNFDYLIQEFATENERLGTVNIYISKNEHREILKYLASTGYLKITKNKSDSPHIIILPKTKPTVRLKSLELIAIDIGELDTGHSLVNFLIEYGVNKRLIVYPNTKWRMIYAVLAELAYSKNGKDKKTLFKIIGGAVHPLMHRGNTVSAETIKNKFNNYLSYDNLELFYNKKENIYKVVEPLSEEEEKEIVLELNKEAKQHLKFLCQSDNKEKISLLRKTYQVLMELVGLFCRNFLRLSQEEIVKLNKHYLALDKTVWDIIDELKLNGVFESYRKYPRPFTNLFSAEKELDGDINWDVIRREMSARFGEIETLYQRVNASDILAEPDKQKQLNDVMLYLSKLKEKTKEVKKKNNAKKPSATRIEITKMPELQIEGLKEIAKAKKRDDKPKFPYKLPAGTRWEEITIKFLDDENVYIQVKQFKHSTSYKEMSFVGKGNNPNPSEAWIFLKVLATLNGELTVTDPKARNKYKKQKELLAKSLQSYFSIDYDPFYPYRSSSEKSGNSYKIKITLIPPPDIKEKADTDKNDNNDLGIKEYLDKQNPQVYNKYE